MTRSIDEDPLTRAIAPPPNESPEERQAREIAESEASRISEEIDNRIRQEKAALKKKKKAVKVLLLGQSESGKSATLKNFQRAYASKEWAADRDSWRTVIQLNLLRNVNDILEFIARELSESNFPSSPRPSSEFGYNSSSYGGHTQDDVPILTEKHQLMKLKLAPLLRIQKDLEKKIGPASSEIYQTNVTTAAPFEDFLQETKPAEFAFHSRNGWKSAFERFRPRNHQGSLGNGNGTVHVRKRDNTADEATEVIARCKDDIKAMWEDPVLRMALDRRMVRIEDSPGFFLDDCERIASRYYQPTDEDIVRARLRTVGIQEYRFTVDTGKEVGREWLMYDVGGSRSSRAAWYPYFDDADAIIFLAPISCFDENLAEDRRVNRLEDSYKLWKSLCSCKLLANVQLVLFLNKCDLLQAKLKRGVNIRDRVPSYGDRANDTATATKYFRQHFKDIAKQYSPVPRPTYIHFTSVIDTKATAMTLIAVEESVLRHHLQMSDLL